MATHNQDDIVVVKIYDDIASATTAHEKLQEAGIKSIVDDMNVVGMTPLAGIEIRVFSNDFEKANEILNEN